MSIIFNQKINRVNEMSKLFKKDTKQFINALNKLTDKRFNFNIVRSYDNGENVFKRGDETCPHACGGGFFGRLLHGANL